MALPPSSLTTRILDALPQTQCTRCSFPDCAAYACAIADEGAPINQCPPGGQEGVLRLSKLTGRPGTPLNATNGLESPRAVAVIDEAWCIGCTLCIDACPTDAIFGASKQMHAVIESHCTGCELCLPVCPVDCIVMENVSGSATGWAAWSAGQADSARNRYIIHSIRRMLNEGLETDAQKNFKLQTVIFTNAASPQAAPDPTQTHAPYSEHTATPTKILEKRAAITAAMQAAREKSGSRKV